MLYQFGPLAPDRAPRLNDAILRVADGVLPTPDGYRPIGQWVEAFSALPASPKGGGTFVSPSGLASIIAGTATGLYKASGGGWTQIGSGYSLQGDMRWRFAQFGGLAIATNSADNMVKIDLATDTVAPLGGNPPKFEMLAVVKDFLVGGVRNGKIMELGWSGINDAEWWTTGQRQADRQILPTGGRINGILSGEYGVILQRDRICRMDYVGGNVIFEISEVSSNIGCVTVHSVAQWGRLGFFLSDEGWMMWDGSQPIPIGREVIDREFAQNYGVEDWPSMSTAVDPVEGVLVIAMPDKMYFYDWLLQKWSTAPYVSPIVFSGVQKSITVDEQDPVVGAPDDTLDSPGLVSFDDPRFNGGGPLLWAFASDGKLGLFSGSPMAATFTGNDIEVVSGRRANLRFVRVESDLTSGATLSLLTRQRLGDAGVSVSFSSIRDSGDMPVRTSGRYTRFTLSVAAGTPWNYIRGLDFVGSTGGGR